MKGNIKMKKICYFYGWFVEKIILSILCFIWTIFSFPFSYVSGFFNPIKREFSFWTTKYFISNTNSSFEAFAPTAILNMLFIILVMSFLISVKGTLIVLSLIFLLVISIICHSIYIEHNKNEDCEEEDEYF